MVTKIDVETYSKEKSGKELIAGFDHFSRDYRIARKIAKSLDFNYDDEVLHAACFLHDIDLGEPHSKLSAKCAEKFLRKKGWSKNKINMVKHCILEHTPKGQPKTPEAIALHDTDLIDFLGATGIIRFSVWAREWEDMSTLKEILNFIKKWRKIASKSIISKKGKEIAKNKIKFMDLTIKQIEKEVR